MFRTSYTKRTGIFCVIYFVILAVLYARPSSLAQEPANSKTESGAALKDFSQLTGGDERNILAASGLPQAGSFDLAKIAAYVVFGAIGFVAFVYGKKNKLFRPMIIGFALMVYPYFISGTFFLYLVGIALTAALYFWRE